MPAFTHDPSLPVYTPSTTKKGAIAVPAPNASLASLESLDRLERRQAEIDREDELDEIRREILHLNSRLDTLLSTQFLVSSCRNPRSRQLVTSVFCLAAVTISTVWSRGRQ